MNSVGQLPQSSSQPDWNNQWTFINAIDHALIGVNTNELDSEPSLTLEEYAKEAMDNSLTLDTMREASLLFSDTSEKYLPKSATDASFLARVVNYIANGTSGRRDEARFKEFDDKLAEEKVIGAQIFGLVPEGGKREFYYLGNRTWIWNESTRNALTGDDIVRKTRYEIKSDVIVKFQDNQPPAYASLKESRDLAGAIRQYVELVDELIYSEPQIAA